MKISKLPQRFDVDALPEQFVLEPHQVESGAPGVVVPAGVRASEEAICQPRSLLMSGLFVAV